MPSLRKTTVEHWKQLLGKFFRRIELSTELPRTRKGHGRHLMIPLLEQVNILMFGAILKKFKTGKNGRPFALSSDI
jgi:hypothetical protein